MDITSLLTEAVADYGVLLLGWVISFFLWKENKDVWKSYVELTEKTTESAMKFAEVVQEMRDATRREGDGGNGYS